MRRTLVTIIALAMVATACGGTSGTSSEDPRATLTSALESLEASAGTTMQLTLQSTPESLRALAAQGGDALPADDAQKILDSSLTISSNLERDPAEAAAQIVVNVGGDEDLEVRVLGTALYVRADVRSLLETFGQDPAMADRFVQQGALSGLDFVQPLVDGEWLEIEGLEQLMSQTGAQPTPTEEQRKVLSDLVESLEGAASVTSEGNDDAGEHLVASVRLRDVYRDLQKAAADLGQLPATGALPSESEVPDETVRVDFWVDDGRLTQVEFDFLQLRDFEDAHIPEGVERLALRVALSEFSGDVERPEGAVPVDLQQVFQGMLGAGAPAGAAP
ncbi:MAG TPA: hypothetical protein VHK89_00210 [Actinomycetota bacterium]|nr:hypothetical protein [Actinomycetota bacterium]